MAEPHNFDEVRGTVERLTKRLQAPIPHFLVRLEEATLFNADGTSSAVLGGFHFPLTLHEYDVFGKSFIPGAKLHARLRSPGILSYTWSLENLLDLVSEVTGPIDYSRIAEIVRSR